MFKPFVITLFVLIFALPAAANPYSINICWFENFNDPILLNYLNEAVENNKDVKIAKKNILKYRQEKNLSISREFPNVFVGADYSLIKIPKLAIPNNDIQTNSFALPFFMAWEVDWLLKNYNRIQKARLDFDIAKFDEKSARLLVVTDFAAGYFNLSNLNKQIELQSQIKKLTEEIYSRKKKMFAFGVISTLELNLAEQDFLNEENTLSKLLETRNSYETSLKYLLGKSPADGEEIQVMPFQNIEFTGVYPESLKGDIVLNRPDILKAESEIKKAKLDVTIAKKDFLPNINVFGTIVFSTIVQNFGWDGVFAALAAGATQNLFDGGRRIFNLKKRKIEYDIALETYLKQDLNALKEINDAMYTLKKDLKVYENTKKQFELSNANFVRVQNSYNEGAKNYPDYLGENTIKTKANRNMFDAKSQNFLNLVTLYKATGGAL